MATKKTTTIEGAKKTAENGRYYYAVGRRKTSVAQIKLFPVDKNQNAILINGKDLEEYFDLARHKEIAKDPLAVAGEGKKFEAQVKVSGGGISSQAEAVRLGISRALVEFDQELKKSLKDKGYLTRDAREVERKKPGLKKARKAPQWAKR
jgi:small subunit ribosomal protein S9